MTSEERFEHIEDAIGRMATTLERVIDSHALMQEQQAQLQQQQAQVQQQLNQSHSQLSEALTQTNLQVRALGHAVESLYQQWQAYVNTLRPH